MDGGMVCMKKKLLECPRHGLVLHRCKRNYWKGAPGKAFADEYIEQCFKCILEGRYKKVAKVKQKQKHISFK